MKWTDLLLTNGDAAEVVGSSYGFLFSVAVVEKGTFTPQRRRVRGGTEKRNP